MPKIMMGDTEVSTGIPIGSARDFYGQVPPSGFLPCDGQALSRASYPELFAVIGTLWDACGGVTAPSATEFRLPPQKIDGLGVYHRGVGDSNAVGSYQVDTFKEHSHRTTQQGADSGASMRGSTSWVATGWTGEPVGDPSETRPRTVTVLKCIYAGR